MNLRNQLTATRQNLMAIARQHSGPRRTELIRSFLRAQLQVVKQADGPAPGQATVLGYDVAFFSAEAFAILLSEVFIEPFYYVELAAERPFIVDGGANIGMSVLLFKHLYPECEILAFEPDPETFALLERNVTVNNLSNVTLVNGALSDEEGELTFFYNPETPGNLAMSTVDSTALEGRRTVAAAVLSDHLSKPVDLLKLDVEGAEHAVVGELNSSGKLGSIDQIVMEYHHHMHGDDRLGEFLVTLEKAGFGYQLGAKPTVPFKKDEFTAMYLYAYRKAATS